jgi:SLA1 homology domain 1, SHD1
MRKHAKAILRLACLALAYILFHSGTCWGIDPVRPGDKIEVHFLNQWRPGEVLSFKNGKALVRYTFARQSEGEFTLDKMRFPNSEGSWAMWTDKSGKFRIAARLIERTETHVKLKKEDDTLVTVPIASLSEAIESKLSRIARIEKNFTDDSLVRVGDQVEWKWFNTWYPATVKKLLPGGALIDYTDGRRTTEKEAKYDDMRYPNGEGPWVDWTDDSGNHKVKARYISHDETHVELLLEGGKSVRMERARLSKKIENELAKRPLITRRPSEIEFDLSSVNYSKLPSWMSFGSNLGKPTTGVLNGIAALDVPPLTQCQFHVTIDRIGEFSPTFYVPGMKPLIGLVITPPKKASHEPVSMHWIDLGSQQVLPGPKFLYGEKIIAYSAEQQRLLTAEGFDLRGTATRFCTYRLEPGASKAIAELRWSVPDVSFITSKSDMDAAFVGDNNALIGYGGSVTLWNFADRRAEYVVPSYDSGFSLSPDKKYFFTHQFSRAVAVETQSGKEVANFDDAGARFCADGKHVLSMGTLGSNLISLERMNKIPIHWGATDKRQHSFNPTLIGSNLIFNGNRLFDIDRKLLIWSYQVDGMQELLVEPIGMQWLAVGCTKSGDSSTTICVGVTSVPTPKVLNSVANISEEQLYVIRPGVEVRVDSKVQDSRILAGLKNSIQKMGWRESSSAKLVIKASAFRAPSQTQNYSISRIGTAAGAAGPSTQTVTASPWMQTVSIDIGETSIWSTGSGGMSTFISARGDASFEAEVRKCEVENYDLFKSIKFPERVLASQWSNGFGTTKLGTKGIVEYPVQ